MNGRCTRLGGAIAVAAMVIAWGGCDSAEQPVPPPPGVALYSTVGAQSLSANTLIRVDGRSGSQSEVGRAGATPAQFSLARDPATGFVYGVNPFGTTFSLARIDPATGETTTAPLSRALSAIAFSPEGRLYGVEASTLCGIDLSSAIPFVFPIGAIAAGEAVVSIDFDAHGTLFAVVIDAGGVRQSLVTVDPATAAVTSTRRIAGGYQVGDIACAPDGFVYGTNFSYWLVRIDPATGVAKLVGNGEIGALGGLALRP